MSSFFQYNASIPTGARIFPTNTSYGSYNSFLNDIRTAEAIMNKPARQAFSQRSIQLAWNLFLTRAKYPRVDSNGIQHIGHSFFQEKFRYTIPELKRNSRLLAEVRKIFMHFDGWIRIEIIHNSSGNYMVKTKQLPILNFSTHLLDSDSSFIAVGNGQGNRPAINYFIVPPTLNVAAGPRIEIPKFFKNPFQGLNSEAVLALTE